MEEMIKRVDKNSEKISDLEKLVYKQAADIQVLVTTTNSIAKSVDKLVNSESSRNKTFLKLESNLDEFKNSNNEISDHDKRILKIEEFVESRKWWYGIVIRFVLPSLAVVAFSLDMYYKYVLSS